MSCKLDVLYGIVKLSVKSFLNFVTPCYEAFKGNLFRVFKEEITSARANIAAWIDVTNTDN